MTKKEMTAEYYQQLKELNEIKLQYKERMVVLDDMNCHLVMLAAMGYPYLHPDIFTWLKSMCDRLNSDGDRISKEISQVENELATLAYLISTLDQ